MSRNELAKVRASPFAINPISNFSSLLTIFKAKGLDLIYSIALLKCFLGSFSNFLKILAISTSSLLSKFSINCCAYFFDFGNPFEPLFHHSYAIGKAIGSPASAAKAQAALLPPVVLGFANIFFLELLFFGFPQKLPSYPLRFICFINFAFWDLDACLLNSGILLTNGIKLISFSFNILLDANK